MSSLQTGLSVAYLAITLLIAVFVGVAALRRRPWGPGHLKVGVGLSAAVAVLLAPSQILGVVALDVFAVLEDPNLPQGVVEQVASTARYLAGAGVVVMAGVSFAWRVWLVPVADGADPSRPAFPVLTGRTRVGGNGLSLAVGVLLGAVSAMLFSALGVDSELLQQQQAWFPGVDFAAWPVVLGIGLPAMLAAAISEELMFRGVLQRWLIRWGQGLGEVAVPLSIAVTSAVWALGHAANTDDVLLKLSQIFGLGLALGALSRRFSVEASIVAHLGFNVAVAMGSLALRG